jgi:signal transduction histidine kinase
VNLLLNARDAMDGNGTVAVSGVPEEHTVTLRVADEGPGISPVHLPRMFEPFFTTKGDSGTGLGLAMAYGLMRALDGDITAANQPGGGAVFSLRFRRWS